jgi:hypothetical protein
MWFDTDSVFFVNGIYENFTILSGSDFFPDYEVYLITWDNGTTDTAVEFYLNATDGTGAYHMQTLTLKINPVNDPPAINITPEWTIHNENASAEEMYNITSTQGLLVELTVNVTDSDSMDLTWDILEFNLTGVAATTDPFVIEDDTGNITFTPTNEHVGEFTVLIEASDGSLTDEMNFTFKVANANDDPMLKTANGVNIANNAASVTGATQDSAFNLTIMASDMDLDIGEADTLTFSATSGNVTLTTEAVGAMQYNISFTPDNDDAMEGSVEVNVTLKDAADMVVDDWALITVAIANVNDQPEITSPTITNMGTIKTTDDPVNVTIEMATLLHAQQQLITEQSK